MKFTKKVVAVDGKVINFPAGDGIITLVCCDCGLTHNIQVTPNQWANGGFTLIFHRNNHSTAQFRRYKKETFKKRGGVK